MLLIIIYCHDLYTNQKIIINYFYKIIKIYNNDTTKESLWIFSHTEKSELTHPKSIIKAETEYKTTNDSWTNNSDTLVIHYTYMWSRLKKTYNDNSVEYSDWTMINTIKKEEKKSPKIIDTKYETKGIDFYVNTLLHSCGYMIIIS